MTTEMTAESFFSDIKIPKYVNMYEIMLFRYRTNTFVILLIRSIAILFQTWSIVYKKGMCTVFNDLTLISCVLLLQKGA